MLNIRPSEQRNYVLINQSTMDVWSWICELPDSEEWYNGTSSLTLQLATSKSNHQSIQLRAERALFDRPSSEDAAASACSLTFSLQFSHSSSINDPPELTILWASDTCHLSQDQPFLPLVLQLLQEIISRSPNAHHSTTTTTCPRSQLRSLKADPVSWNLDSHSPESLSNFFNLIFLTRLFWICVFEAASQVGSLYFHSLLAPNLEMFSCKHAPVLRTFFVSVGTDVELSLMRTFGYMLAKSLIFREMVAGVAISKALSPTTTKPLGLSYAMESHGMWILKGYNPLAAMKRVFSSRPSNNIEPKESVLRYALAHQQLEAVIQLEYTVGFCDGFIQVHASVDNIRLHVVKLGFKKNKKREEGGDNEDVNHHASILNERHFPSRVRVWVGPEVGTNYVGSLSLGRSTENVEREVEMQKIVRGSSGKFKEAPRKVKTGMARMSTRTKIKNWRWDQDVEGNAAIFDGILCDNATGVEVATWQPPNGVGSGENNFPVVNSNFTRRHNGGSRAFTKSGGVVFAGEECGGACGGAGWRLSKDMEGSVLKWRIGGEVWLSHWPNDARSSYYETRSVEFCDEVDLPLIPGRCT